MHVAADSLKVTSNIWLHYKFFILPYNIKTFGILYLSSVKSKQPDSLEFLTISLILRLNLMVTNNLFWGKTRWSQKIITETVKKGRYWGYLKLRAVSDLSKKCFDLIKMNMPGHMWLVKVRTDYVYVLCSLS